MEKKAFKRRSKAAHFLKCLGQAICCLSLLGGTAPNQAQSLNPDFVRMVVLGDSLMAGYRDGGLADRYQATSIPALIAHQARVSMPQPLIGWPGLPGVLQLIQPGIPPVIAPYPGTSSGRLDASVQPMNLAVPGATVKDALSTRPDLPIDSMTDLILGLPGLLSGVSRSQVEWAEALKPTTILVWVGNNDALNAAIAGNTNALTPQADFQASYTAMMDRLKATGATLVVANIPDVASIPYVQSIKAVAAMIDFPVALVAGALGISENDYITLDSVPDVVDILGQKKPGPLGPEHVLTAAEIQAIRNATVQYNAVIQAQAQAKGAIFVDANAFLNRLQLQGAEIGSRHISADYLGGIFGLDGVHPTAEGAMVTANEFIAAMNKAGAHVPPFVWLKSAVENNQLVLRWPVTQPAYQLFAAEQASFANATPVAGSTLTADGQNEVRVPLREGKLKFFHLVPTTN